MSAINPLWQSLIVTAIGVVAVLYLLRRWWPALRGLWQRPVPEAAGATEACGKDVPAPGGSKACGGGCSHCGSSSPAPERDHRVIPLRPDSSSTRRS